jgi:hypothetical protein
MFNLKPYTVERFCPLCVAPIIALAAGGTAGAVALTDQEKKKRRNNIIIWTLVSIALSLLLWYAWAKYNRKCKSCEL